MFSFPFIPSNRPVSSVLLVFGDTKVVVYF